MTETYYGKNPSLIKIEELFSILSEKIKNHENIDKCPEKQQIELILGKLFGFEFVNFTIIHSTTICNAFTLPFINTSEYKGEKDYELIRDKNGIRFKYPKDKTLYVVFYDYNFLNFDSETLMGMLLHEIGHNFFMVDDIIKGNKQSLAFSYLMDLFSIGILILMSGKVLLPLPFFVDLVNLNLYKNDPNKWSHNLVKYSDSYLNQNDDLYKLHDKIFNTTIFKFLINGVNFIFNNILPFTKGIKAALKGVGINILLASFSVTSGLLSGYNPGYNNEKFADNFAATYGYATGLANFMNKPEKIYVDELSTKIPIIRVYNYCNKLFAETLIAFSDPHPASCSRVKAMKSKLEFELKNTKLSPSHRKEIEIELDKINKIIDEIPKYRKNINKSFEFIINLKDKKMGQVKMSDEEIYDFDNTFLKNHITNEDVNLISEEVERVHKSNHDILNSYLS